MKTIKKISLLIVIFITLFFINTNKGVAAELPRAKVSDNDYIITCVYHNGMVVTVSKTSITLVRANNEPGTTSTNEMLFFLDNQVNKRDSNGKITQYNTDNFLSSSKCPKALYAYEVENNVEDDVNKDQLGATILEDVNNYVYSTKKDLTTDETGKDSCFLGLCDAEVFERIEDGSQDAHLVSESVELTSSKSVPICDYQVYVENPEDGETAKATLSLYLFKNITFVTLGNYTAPLSTVESSCPTREEGKILYINNPKPESTVISNAPDMLTFYSGVKNFYASDNQNNCYDNNDKKTCAAYTFLGERNGGSESSEDALCEKLSDETIAIIQDVVEAMQIVVPGLVIILTGIDIGKLVLSGNLDEELPKKKKTILIRIIVMAIFFFLPLLTDLIIGLLKDAGLIGVEYVSCIFEK